jgi:hypothetical protein
MSAPGKQGTLPHPATPYAYRNHNRETIMIRKQTMVLLMTSLLACGGLAHADVGEKATEAKDATVNAAKKTGHAVGTAASSAVDTAKSVGHGVADTAKEVYHKSKNATKKAIGKAAEKTEDAAETVKEKMSE